MNSIEQRLQRAALLASGIDAFGTGSFVSAAAVIFSSYNHVSAGIIGPWTDLFSCFWHDCFDACCVSRRPYRRVARFHLLVFATSGRNAWMAYYLW